MIRVYIITCLNQIQPTQVARNRLTVNETSSAALAQSCSIGLVAVIEYVTMQTKLTLRMDKSLIQRAKSYSNKSGKSVSQIVADYFALLDDGSSKEVFDLTPVVRSLKGSLRNVTVNKEDYRQYLEDKYL